MPSLILNPGNTKSFLQAKLFFDNETAGGVQRFEQSNYPTLLTLAEKQLGFFWRPQGVPMLADRVCMDTKMAAHHKHMFTANLRRQIMLDTVNSRGPVHSFLPLVSHPSLEDNFNIWNFFEEAIHSRSYTHIIRSVYPEPGEIFDETLKIPEVLGAARSICSYYDPLADMNRNKIPVEYGGYKHCKALYLGLGAANALEAIRFFVSFATNFALAENGLMVRSADILQYIARDENVHLSLLTWVMKTLPKDDPERFEQVVKDCRDELIAIYEQAAAEEKEWARYLLSEGPMLGLNLRILESYVDYLLVRRLRALGLTRASAGENPIPWIDKYLNSATRQEAPQEKNVTGYVLGGIHDDHLPGQSRHLAASL